MSQARDHSVCNVECDAIDPPLINVPLEIHLMDIIILLYYIISFHDFLYADFCFDNQPLKFGNGCVIPSHILMGMWLLSHSEGKVEPWQ